MINPFFKNQGPFKIEDILYSSNTGNKNNYTGSKIIDIKDLLQQQIMILLFFIPKNMKVQLLILKHLIV